MKIFGPLSSLVFDSVDYLVIAKIGMHTYKGSLHALNSQTEAKLTMLLLQHP